MVEARQLSMLSAVSPSTLNLDGVWMFGEDVLQTAFQRHNFATNRAVSIMKRWQMSVSVMESGLMG